MTSAASSSAGGVSSEATPTRSAVFERAHLDELAEAAEGVDVRGVVADVERGGELGVAQQRDDPGALVDADGRADLEHLATPVRVEARLLGRLGDLADGGLGLLLVGHLAPVQRRDRLLVLEAHAQAAQVRRSSARGRSSARAGSRPAARGPSRSRSSPGAGSPSRASRGRRSSRARRRGGRRTRGARTRRRRRRRPWRPRSAAGGSISGMWASSGCWTIGASTPSTSSRTAARSGSSLRGRRSSSREAVEAGTALSMPPRSIG